MEKVHAVRKFLEIRFKDNEWNSGFCSNYEYRISLKLKENSNDNILKNEYLKVIKKTWRNNKGTEKMIHTYFNKTPFRQL